MAGQKTAPAKSPQQGSGKDAPDKAERKKTLRIWKRLKEDRQKWDGTLQKAGEYFLPMSAGLSSTTSLNKGEARGQRVYDTTGAESLQTRSANIIGKLFPAGQEWMECETEEIAGLSTAEKKQLDEHSEDAARKFNLAMKNSNFDMEIAQSMPEALISTSALIFHAEKPAPGVRSPFRFEVIPLRKLHAEEGLRSRLTRVMFPRDVRAEDVKAMWPDAEIPAKLAKAIEEEPERMLVIHDCFLPNGPDETGAFYEVWWLEEEERLLRTKYNVSPVLAYRFSKDAGENLGRGPALAAAPEVYTINTAKEITLSNAELQMRGVYNSFGIENFDLTELEGGEVIPTTQPGGGLSRVDVGGNLNIGEYIIADGRQAIRSIIEGESLPGADDGIRSAYEIATRSKRAAQIEIPTTLRLIVELVMPLGHRGLDILQSMDWATDPRYGIQPLVFTRRDGRADIPAVVPAMKNPILRLYEEAEAATLAASVAEAMQIWGPERVALNVRMNKALRDFLEMRGMDAKHLQDADFVEQMDDMEREQIKELILNMVNQSAAQGQQNAPAPAQGAA